jgi:hypothetical protein
MPPKPGKRQLPDRRVLRLLPQPGGFEGLRMAWILLGPHGEPIAEATEVAGFGIEDAAAPEPEASVAECEDEVAEVSNLLNAHSELLECRLQFRPPFPEAFVPVKGLAALDLRGERMPLDIGVGDLEQRPYVSPVVRLDSALEGLDVLLRHHRSRSIPPRGGGCQSKTALSEDRRVAKLAQIKRGLNPPHKPSGPQGDRKRGGRSLDKAPGA